MLNKFFKLDENKTDFKTEILAGITTFLAMSYILGVNPGMLSETGMSLEGVFIACMYMFIIFLPPKFKVQVRAISSAFWTQVLGGKGFASVFCNTVSVHNSIRLPSCLHL